MEKKEKKPKSNETGLKMYYQPVIATMFDKVVGYEALIRLIDKELHFISPGIFIPIAEKSGLNVALGNWIFEETCNTLQKMVKKGIDFEYISLNVSVKHLKKKEYVPDLLAIVNEIGADPGKLGLEIPEDAFNTVAGTEATIERIHELKHYGFKVSIDDYGSDYLSLSSLESIPVDSVKLDKTLTDKMGIDAKVREKLETIIRTTADMNIDAIAKTVEDEKQKKMLSEMGCRKMQGYLFGKPVKERDILYPKVKKVESED